MEEPKQETELEKKSREILEARTGKDLVIDQKEETPLEEVRRLNKETKEQQDKLQASIHKLETLKAEEALAGRAKGGAIQEEEDPKKKAFQDGERMAKDFMGIPK